MLSTIVPTIEATTISPIGTKTVTLSDRQVSVAGSRSTPSFESARAPTPRMPRISAAPSRALPAATPSASPQTVPDARRNEPDAVLRERLLARGGLDAKSQVQKAVVRCELWIRPANDRLSLRPDELHRARRVPSRPRDREAGRPVGRRAQLAPRELSRLPAPRLDAVATRAGRAARAWRAEGRGFEPRRPPTPNHAETRSSSGFRASPASPRWRRRSAIAAGQLSQRLALKRAPTREREPSTPNPEGFDPTRTGPPVPSTDSTHLRRLQLRHAVLDRVSRQAARIGPSCRR